MTEDIGWVELGVRPDPSGFGRSLGLSLMPEMDRAGRSAASRFSSGMKRALALGGGVALFGAAGSFVADSVRLEAEFSKTFAQIGVATNASADQLKSLDALAIKLGKDTIFSANEASSAMLELAKNGIAPATIRAGALKSALTLAAAGGVDLTEAATTMGNALNAFGLKGKQAASVSAALAGAANASSASVGSLAEGLQQSAATANDVGLNIQETTGILAAFANAGISGSDAGTSLKTMLSRLNPMTDRAQTAMARYGITFVKANGEFKNAVQIAAELKDGLGDLSAADRSAALNTIFGSDARRAATILTKEGAAGIRDYIKATSDQSAAERMANASMSGTAGAIEKLKGSWETLKLQFGKEIAPVAADFLNSLANGADDAAPKLRAFGSWIREDGVPALKALAKFGANAAGVIGDIISAVNKLPSEAKYAGLLALVGGIGAAKLRGGSGALGTLGRAVGAMKPVPVFVTNTGFGAGGLGGGVTGRGPRAINAVPLVGSLAIGGEAFKESGIPDKISEKFFGQDPALARAVDGGREGMKAYLAQLKATAEYWQTFEFKADGAFTGVEKLIIENTNHVKAYQRVLGLTPKQLTTVFKVNGIDRAVSQAKTLRAELQAAADVSRGLDNGVPYLHGGVTYTGDIHNHGVTDERSFQQAQQRRHRRRSLGGVG